MTFRANIVWACLLLWALMPVGALGQRPVPFQTLEVGFEGAANVNRNFLHEFWQQGRGGGLSVATPFYLGMVELGGTFHRYGQARQDLPPFNAVLLFLGWGIPVQVTQAWSVGTTFRLGSYRMMFDEATFRGVRTENELTVEARVRLAYRLSPTVRVFAAGSYHKTFTFHRLKLFYATAGMSVAFTTPRWLQDFLQ